VVGKEILVEKEYIRSFLIARLLIVYNLYSMMIHVTIDTVLRWDALSLLGY
jgi:hypothetical protein